MKTFRLPNPIWLLILLAAILAIGITSCSSSKHTRTVNIAKTDSSGKLTIQQDSVSVKKQDQSSKKDSSTQKENNKKNYSEITLDFEVDSSGNHNKPAVEINNGTVTIKTTGNLKKAQIKTNSTETNKDATQVKTENNNTGFDSTHNKKNTDQSTQLNKKTKDVQNQKEKEKPWLGLVLIAALVLVVLFVAFRKK